MLPGSLAELQNLFALNFIAQDIQYFACKGKWNFNSGKNFRMKKRTRVMEKNSIANVKREIIVNIRGPLYSCRGSIKYEGCAVCKYSELCMISGASEIREFPAALIRLSLSPRLPVPEKIYNEFGVFGGQVKAENGLVYQLPDVLIPALHRLTRDPLDRLFHGFIFRHNGTHAQN